MYRLLFFLAVAVFNVNGNVAVSPEGSNTTELPEYYDYEYDSATTEVYEYYDDVADSGVETTITPTGVVIVREKNGQPNSNLRRSNKRRRNNRRGNNQKNNNNRRNNNNNRRKNNNNRRNNNNSRRKNNNRRNNNRRKNNNKKKKRPGRRPGRRPNKQPSRRPNKRPTNRPDKKDPPQPSPTESPHADIINQISWKDRINGGRVMIIEEDGHQQFYSLGFNEENSHLGICYQSHNLGGSSGVCRYLRYCMEPLYIQDYNNFFDNKCITSNGFVGVCCPEGLPEPLVTEKPTSPKPEKFLENCGRNIFSRTRIVGGNKADPKEYPWMAALITEERPGVAESFCGGVLITDTHVLTASHCLIGSKPEDFKIRLGEYDFARSNETAERDFTIKSITRHEHYNTTNQRNDIAIITLATSTEYNDDIWPICLPDVGDTYEGEYSTVVGWGTLRFAGDVSSELMEVVLPIWTLKRCNESFSRLSNPIVSTQICAGDEDGNKDSCQGDSGGPLMHFDMSTLQWNVIGIVSYGYYCATPGYPGVYTRVNSYLDWIHNVLDST